MCSFYFVSSLRERTFTLILKSGDRGKRMDSCSSTGTWKTGTFANRIPLNI